MVFKINFKTGQFTTGTFTKYSFADVCILFLQHSEKRTQSGQSNINKMAGRYNTINRRICFLD